ncbi:sulfite reductase, ferredoxin dependent [filamentous cyanobacterium CCP5]|nr:sulfite reductase, ferredoxin dependent [filamentous cyanobacterium CCP5]
MVQTPIKPGSNEQKRSKLEGIKERSNFLREPLASEVLNDASYFTGDATQILKFHGSYQQDNRDNRVRGQDKDYRMMLRTRNPGGFIPPQLYLALDGIADDYGYGHLRATTRQGFQLHGILKQDLKASIAAIVKNLGSTLGACGDLNRNVMAPPAPFKNKPEYEIARQYADTIADLLRPQTEAYFEIWLDGEKFLSVEEAPEVAEARERNGTGTIFHDSSEPIYGTYYMPRKFKVAVTVPGDNSVDAYTQDVTLVVITDDQGEHQGFNVLAGGGMGRTHNKEETFARIADEIGYVDKADVYELMKAIVATQRDYGDRFNRRHARMKYLINDMGVDWFRQKVEGYLGKPLQPYQLLSEWKFYDYLGWQEQGDGKLFVGIPIENGRVLDNGPFKLKRALKELVQRFNLPMRVTPNQSVILYEIDPHYQAEIQGILTSHGIQAETDLDPLVRFAMACPALPMCGLAVTESERIIPSILERLRSLMTKLNLKDEHFVVRMTGCPNGCARPYMAELGFVGTAPDSYQIWLGGSPNQTRLARTFMERLHVDNLEKELEPIFVCFRDQRQAGESFGDFCDRLGFEALRQFAEGYVPVKTNKENRHRISLNNDSFALLKAASDREGRPMSQITADAIAQYLKQQL